MRGSSWLAQTGPVCVSAVRASGCEAEVRAVADRIHLLLEDGVEPECVAVVARDLDRYAVAFVSDHIDALSALNDNFVCCHSNRIIDRYGPDFTCYRCSTSSSQLSGGCC